MQLREFVVYPVRKAVLVFLEVVLVVCLALRIPNEYVVIRVAKQFAYFYVEYVARNEFLPNGYGYRFLVNADNLDIAVKHLVSHIDDAGFDVLSERLCL